jgi:hypothetical protein
MSVHVDTLFNRSTLVGWLGALALTTLVAGCDCNSSPQTLPDSGVPCPSACAKGTYCCKKTLTCEQEKYNCSNLQGCPAGQELTYPSGPYMNEGTCEPLPLQCSCKQSDTLKPGMIGRFASLAASGGTLMASAYDSDFGDLVLVSAKTSALDALTPEIVDGVPNVAPTKLTTGWRGGIEDAGDDVGQDTSLAITASGSPVIAYRDVTNRTLKLATRSADGKWSTHVVDSPKGSKEIVGRYASLLMIGDSPTIAYTALNLEGTAGVFTSELRWASANTATPTGGSDWTISVIESKPMSCQNLCASTDACVIKTATSSACEKKGTACSPACLTDEQCVGTACKKILPDLAFVDVPRASGLWPSPVLSSSSPVVVYHDRLEGKLKAAAGSAASWKLGTIDGGTDGVGAFCTAVADKAVVHVSYQNTSKLTLSYAQLSATTLTPSLTEVVDDGIRSDGTHPVGADSAILIDGAGAIRIIYQDQRTSDLLAAKRIGANNWTPRTATDANLGRLLKGGPKGYGFYSRLALDGGQVFGATFFFDPNATPKGGLVFFPVP